MSELNNCPSISWQPWIEEAYSELQVPETIKKIANRLTPLGNHVYEVATKVGDIIGKMFSDGSGFFSSIYKIVSKVQIIAIVFIPLKVYNIVSIWRSNQPIGPKCVDTAIEVGGMISIGATVVNWVTNNIRNASAVIPYLLGVSILFGGVDIYKKSCELIKIKQVALDILQPERLNEITHKILSNTLSDSEKQLLEESFQIKNLQNYREQALKSDSDKIQQNLEKRITRTTNSIRVALAASVIDVIASSLIFAVCFVAPEIGIPLGFANSTLLGVTSITRVIMHFFDWKTEQLDIEPTSEIELQDISNVEPPDDNLDQLNVLQGENSNVNPGSPLINDDGFVVA